MTTPIIIREPEKRYRNKLSDSELRSIQEDLNQGDSVNSIAKRKKIPESTIRKAIQRGQLEKHSHFS
jgi:DNA-binding NarL/FixJ family response regulator